MEEIIQRLYGAPRRFLETAEQVAQAAPAGWKISGITASEEMAVITLERPDGGVSVTVSATETALDLAVQVDELTPDGPLHRWPFRATLAQLRDHLARLDAEQPR